MGGRLAVRSELGDGSTFFFVVPIRRELHPAVANVMPIVQSVVQSVVQPVGAEAGQIIPFPVERSAPEAPANKLQILLVEDLPANQMLVVHVLNRRGHSVEVANNGRQAVELASQRPFDLVLMDLQMPDMDGFEATAAIRALPTVARIPIVALTAHALPADRDRCLAAGMDDYLAKPLDVRKLVQVVEANASLRPMAARKEQRQQR
jgi:CheY-like chemotaxis protein